MRQYELTYLISDNVPESDLNKVTGKVLSYIKDAGGKLLKEEIWGRRKLAYPIQKLEFATYITVNFDLPSEKAKEFEYNIVMTRKIIRHLMIVKDFGTEELTLTAEDIAETKEIEEVVGGEKSFEIIEGMTDKSRDLMATRDQDETAPALQSESRPESVGKESKELMSVRGEKEEDNKEEEKLEEKDIKEEISKKEVAPPEGDVPTDDDKKEPVVGTEKPKAEKAEKKTKSAPKKVKKSEDNEADRLSKLDKELDDILGEEL